MELFDNTWYGITVCVTTILLIASTIYTIRNILRIWRKGTPVPASGDDDTKDPTEKDDVKPLLEAGDAPDVDPMEYCEHIQSEVKKAKFRVAEKKIGETMTAEQIAEEKELQKKQLEEIFNLMQEQNERFGVNSVEDIQNQMKLYA